MDNRLMSQDEFDRRIDFQRQKIAARKQMHKMIQDDYQETGFRWNTLQPEDEDIRINVISKNNVCTSKSCMEKTPRRRSRQLRFGEEIDVTIRAIPKGDDEYLFSEDEPPARIDRFGAEPKVDVRYYPRGNEEYFFSDDEEEEEEEAIEKPFRKEDIMSQADFDRKIGFQKQKIAARKLMKNLIDDDYQESGMHWTTLQPHDDMRVNVISKANPCTAKSCMLRGENVREAKQLRFGAEPQVVVREIPKGDQYLYSDDEDDEEDDDDGDEDDDEDDDNFYDAEDYDDNDSTTEESEDEDDNNQGYETSYDYEPQMACPNYEVKMAPAMVQDDNYDEPEQHVNTYMYMGKLNVKNKNQAARNTTSSQNVRNHG